jgi:hypothetical protein
MHTPRPLNGGTLVLASGAVVSGRVAFTGGGTPMPTAIISGFLIGDAIDLASVASGSGGNVVLSVRLKTCGVIGIICVSKEVV